MPTIENEISAETLLSSISAQTVPAETAETTEQPVKARKARKAQAAKTAETKSDAENIFELSSEAREILRKFYSGASEAIHSRKPNTRGAYADRCLIPVQRIGTAPTSRDDSALALLYSESKAKTRAFDPEKIGGTGADLGCVSRLASVHFISYNAESDTFTVTETGAKRARLLLKKTA